MSRFYRKLYQVNNFICDVQKMTKIFYPIYDTENILSGYIVTRVFDKPTLWYHDNIVKRSGDSDINGNITRQCSLIVKKSLSKEDKVDIIHLYIEFLKENNLRPQYIIDVDNIETRSKYIDFRKKIKNNFPQYVIENFIRVKLQDKVILVYKKNLESFKHNFNQNNISFYIMQSAKTPVSFRLLKEFKKDNKIIFNNNSNYFYLEQNHIMKGTVGLGDSFNIKLYIKDNNKEDIVIPQSKISSTRRRSSILIRNAENSRYLSRKINMSDVSIINNCCIITLFIAFDDLVSTISTIHNKYDVYVVRKNEIFEIQRNFNYIMKKLIEGYSEIPLLNRKNITNKVNIEEVLIKEYYIIITKKKLH